MRPAGEVSTGYIRVRQGDRDHSEDAQSQYAFQESPEISVVPSHELQARYSASPCSPRPNSVPSLVRPAKSSVLTRPTALLRRSMRTSLCSLCGNTTRLSCPRSFPGLTQHDRTPEVKTALSSLPPKLSSSPAQQKFEAVVVGIESHICVTQTTLDLLSEGHKVYVLADGVSSCNKEEVPIALARLRAEGAIITTSESWIYECMGDAGIEECVPPSVLMLTLLRQLRHPDSGRLPSWSRSPRTARKTRCRRSARYEYAVALRHIWERLVWGSGTLPLYVIKASQDIRVLVILAKVLGPVTGTVFLGVTVLCSGAPPSISFTTNPRS